MSIKFYTTIIFILLAGIYLAGCNIINPKEPTPTYVHIDSFHFVPGNYVTTGSSSHDITNAWVYYNNSLVGVFDLPATIPIITNSTGNGQVVIEPGIKADGLNDYLQAYPFYRLDTFTLISNPGQIITHNPTTGYDSGTSFVYIENFNPGSTPFVKDPYSKVIADNYLTVVSAPADLVFENSGSGYIYLDSTIKHDSSISFSTATFDFPSSNAYMELNYKGTVPFYVGFRPSLDTFHDVPQYLIGFKESTTWQKAYIPLTEYIQATPLANKFEVVIKAGLSSTQATGYLSIDNIKIVSR